MRILVIIIEKNMAQTPKYAFLFVVFIMFTFLVDAGNHVTFDYFICIIHNIKL